MITVDLFIRGSLVISLTDLLNLSNRSPGDRGPQFKESIISKHFLKLTHLQLVEEQLFNESVFKSNKKKIIVFPFFYIQLFGNIFLKNTKISLEHPFLCIS